MWPLLGASRFLRSIQSKFPASIIICNFMGWFFLHRTGKIELEIKIPAEQVTSVAFGGPNLDILYVTTASKEFKSPQPAPAGSLFKVTNLGAKGTKMTSVKLN